MTGENTERRDKAIKMLVRFKSDLMGTRAGMWEQERDTRFVNIVIKLLAELNSEDEVINWLQRPCGCSECYDLSPQPSRLDLVNSAYGTKHLLRQFDIERAAAFGD